MWLRVRLLNAKSRILYTWDSRHRDKRMISLSTLLRENAHTDKLRWLKTQSDADSDWFARVFPLDKSFIGPIAIAVELVVISDDMKTNRVLEYYSNQ